MKNILKISLLMTVLAVFLFTGCEKDRTKYEYTGAAFIHLGERSYEVMENATDTLEVIIFLSHPQATDITVGFDITTSQVVAEQAVLGVDYNRVPAGSDVTFAAGETQKVLQFIPIDDTVEDDTTFKVINVALASNTGGLTMGFPGPDELNSTTEVTIKDNDCDITLEMFSGKVNGTETSPWWIDAGNEYTFTPVGFVSPNVVEYEVTGFWYNQLLSAQGSEWFVPGAGEEYEFYSTGFFIDYSDVTAPTYTIVAGTVLRYNWGSGDNYYAVAAETDKPLKISTCEKTLEFDYTMTAPSWAGSYRFLLKFDF